MQQLCWALGKRKLWNAAPCEVGENTARQNPVLGWKGSRFSSPSTSQVVLEQQQTAVHAGLLSKSTTEVVKSGKESKNIGNTLQLQYSSSLILAHVGTAQSFQIMYISEVKISKPDIYTVL